MSALWAKSKAYWTAVLARVRRGAGGASRNSELGAAGERAAEAHLRANGLRLLVRNWRNPADEREEIDLVCEEPPGPGDLAPVLVFVEVKARAAGARVAGYHAVNKRKKAVLLRACRAYLARLRPPPRHVRFDVVEVAHGADAALVAATAAMRLDPNIASIREGRLVWHYRDVPLFPDRASHNHDRHG
jgi:putative endonuclease